MNTPDDPTLPQAKQPVVPRADCCEFACGPKANQPNANKKILSTEGFLFKRKETPGVVLASRGEMLTIYVHYCVSLLLDLANSAQRAFLY